MKKLLDFRCSGCGFEFEKFSTTDKTECPLCGETANKLLSSPAIKVNGVGAYTNKMKV